MYSTIEKKSLVSKKIAIARINAIHARRVDLSKPTPVRIETCRASGVKRVRSLALAGKEFGWSAR
jgi:hypothetical protein